MFVLSSPWFQATPNWLYLPGSGGRVSVCVAGGLTYTTVIQHHQVRRIQELSNLGRSVSLSVCLSVCLSVSLSVCRLSVSLSVACLSVACLSVCPSVCVSSGWWPLFQTGSEDLGQQALYLSLGIQAAAEPHPQSGITILVGSCLVECIVQSHTMPCCMRVCMWIRIARKSILKPRLLRTRCLGLS